MSSPSVRMCVGCRKRSATSELLRVVAVERGSGLEAVPDPSRRAQGRGAHVHPTSGCLELALRRRVFARALRVPSGVGTGTLERLAEEVRRPPDASVLSTPTSAQHEP